MRFEEPLQKQGIDIERDIVKNIDGAESMARADNHGRVGSSMGLDLTLCFMSCSFCSLGERWHLFENSHEISPDTVVLLIRDTISKGYWQFTIRTTQHYDLEKLCALGKIIRGEIPGKYYLTANTGELSIGDAEKLKEAGFTSTYHAIRLREGVDTLIPPKTRLETIRNARRAELEVTCGVDPIGIEHTNEELVNFMELYRTLDLKEVCIMRKDSVKGAPKGDLEETSKEKLTQIVAAGRFAGTGKWSNVAVYPQTQMGMESGTNVCAVETGANPRFAEPDTNS